MKHPDHEQWMAWLYDELAKPEKNRLAAHLKECGQCRAEVRRWEGTRRVLDLGATPATRSMPVSGPQALLKWAVAACFLLAIGFGAGRLILPGHAADPAMRASLKAELHDELLAELKREQSQALAEYKLDADTRQAENDKLVFTALGKEATDRVASYASLRKALETVAVYTQDGLQEAQQQMVTLASYSQPDGKKLNQ